MIPRGPNQYGIITADSESDLIRGLNTWYPGEPERQTPTPAASPAYDAETQTRIRRLEEWRDRYSRERKELVMKDMYNNKGWRTLPELPEGVNQYMNSDVLEHYKATLKFPIEVAIWQYVDMEMKCTLFNAMEDVPYALWREIDLFRPITMMTEVYINGAYHKTPAK